MRDFVSGLLTLALGVAMWLYAGTFPGLPEGHPGPALFPRLIAAGLALAGLALGVAPRQMLPERAVQQLVALVAVLPFVSRWNSSLMLTSTPSRRYVARASRAATDGGRADTSGAGMGMTESSTCRRNASAAERVTPRQYARRSMSAKASGSGLASMAIAARSTSYATRTNSTRTPSGRAGEASSARCSST